MYHEDSNWWEEESKDESTGSVAVTLSHPGSAAKSLSLKKMQTSYICTDVSVRNRIRDVTDSCKMINTMGQCFCLVVDLLQSPQ